MTFLLLRIQISLKLYNPLACLSISFFTSSKETDFIFDSNFEKVSVIKIIECRVYWISSQAWIEFLYCSIYHRIIVPLSQTLLYQDWN
jgi:hypothetical protein